MSQPVSSGQRQRLVDVSLDQRTVVVRCRSHGSKRPQLLDQHRGLAALVAWVEQGTAPEQLVASVNPTNPEVPADWSPTRSRPLCVYPQVPQYAAGDPESASSFVCETPHPGLAYGTR